MLETTFKPISDQPSPATMIAAQFRAARLENLALAEFPGSIPTSLQQAYIIQDQAIADWPDVILGWKVGRILGDLAIKFGVNRLIGPIFSTSVAKASAGTLVEFDAISGGFCAVEGEFVFELGTDADPTQTSYEGQDALALVQSLWTGIEIAGSPLATINALGPTVVISDFGNNKGLILGNQVAQWRERLERLCCEVAIDDTIIGTGCVDAFPGGITQSLVFALNTAAQRGHPLKAGMLISTGAVTGVHDIVEGQTSTADFGSDGKINCQRVANGRAGVV
jgi:2-keto-4-pentenoate hydratase